MSSMQIRYQYLRPLKADALKVWYNEKFTLKGQLSVQTYKGATILPLRRVAGDNLLFGRGGVIDSNNRYVELSAIKRRIEGSYEFTDIKFKDEKVVYCGYLINHWGHFLVETVARLWYFLKADPTIDKYVFFIGEKENRQIEGNFREFFELFGIWKKIEIINVPTRYREVVIPELGYKWRTYYSEQYKLIFRTVAANVKVDPEWESSEKIYFTRSRLKGIKEKEFGLEMLDDYFERNGYKVVSPEKMSLSHLIFLLQNAEIIASLSGSLPHNLLFGEDGKNLIIIERNVLNNEIQVDINKMKSLHVTYVDANIPIYSINLGWGPFIMSYDGMLAKFSQDNHYIEPDNRFLSKKYMKSLFVRYMKSYMREYHYQWFMEDWAEKYVGYIREGYKAGYDYYKEYLSGEKPFLLRHYFQKHYMKRIIKKFLRK